MINMITRYVIPVRDVRELETVGLVLRAWYLGLLGVGSGVCDRCIEVDG